MSRKKKIGFIYTFYNRLEFLRVSIRSFRKYTNMKYVEDIVAVDAGSMDGTQKLIRDVDLFRKVVNVKPGIVGDAMIAGLKEVQGDYIMHIPNDMVFSYIWLGNIYDTFEYFNKRINLVILAFGDTYPHSHKCGRHIKRKKGFGVKLHTRVNSLCIAKKEIWDDFINWRLRIKRKPRYGEWQMFQGIVKGRKGFIYPNIGSLIIDRILLHDLSLKIWKDIIKDELNIFKEINTIDKIAYLIRKYERSGWTRQHKK